MYGIVNKAIEGLITDEYGADVFELIKHASGFKDDFFLSNFPYDDQLTYDLLIHASKITNVPMEELLFRFGEYWVRKTGFEQYGNLMRAGGADLKAFLINLPNLHNRIMLIYPEVRPPEFIISDVSDNFLLIHYFSERQGLQYFVKGLLQGLGDMYNEPVHVQIRNSRAEGSDHDVFEVKWITA
jgi:Haem-NO-binding